MNHGNKKLMALTTAALALPGMTPKNAIAATSAPTDFTASYRFTNYQENSVDPLIGSDDRYDISVHQLGFVAPLSDKLSMNLDLSTESMSGASPWYVLGDNDGKPLLTMSGATIEENRQDYRVSVSRYGEKGRLGFGLAHSTENDYNSVSLNVNASLWFNEKNTILDAGIAYSDDTVEPTQDPSVDPGRIVKADKTMESVSFGFSQILSKTLLFGAGINYANYDGFLSDPYKLVAIAGDITRVRDHRPDVKTQISFDVKARKYLNSINAALHLDYRHYDNNWGVLSHTFDVALYKNVNSWQFISRIRWYDQSAALFYRNFYTQERQDGFYSSDYRLSAYGAVSVRLGISKQFERWRLKALIESYNSGKGLESEGHLNPGLVDFNYATIGFDFRL